MEDLFEQPLLTQLAGQLLIKNETIAIAESVTSGMLQQALSCCPNAARFYEGGITTYNLEQKAKHLHIDREHAAAVNCVSQQVADEMALQVRELFNSTWGIGVTGYASPVPESGNELFAYYAVARQGSIQFHGKISANEADVSVVQQSYAQYILMKFNYELANMQVEKNPGV